MPRTEQSLGCTGPKGHLNDRRPTAEDFELEDLAQAYGARMPDSLISFDPPHSAGRDPLHGAHPFS